MRKPEVIESLVTQENETAEIIPIRTETVLCQYPIHKLSKSKKPVQIKLIEKNRRGKGEVVWKVSPNAEYGHPGELAYKIDTLVINRLIDELYPDIPEVIKIADSLRRLSELAGKEKTGDTSTIKRALYQNAGALITAKLEFTGKDKTQRMFEFASTRYGIVFTGERLPNGETADAIYIILNPLYRDLLRHAKRRPLDYEYLKKLPPTAQRWYELVSFQIFAALNLGNPRARYVYSELCERADLPRFFTWEQAKKQLYKIHRPHIKSGYISKFEAEQTTDKQGRPDWFLWYTPGQKAKREYREFNERPLVRESAPKTPAKPHLVEARKENQETFTPERSSEDSTLIEKLTSFGIDEGRAAQLVESNRTESVLWANAWPYQNQKGMENPPAVLISFIEKKRRPLPKAYKEAIEWEQQKNENEAARHSELAGELHFQFFAPIFRARLEEELSEIARTLPDAYNAFEEHFDRKHAKDLRRIESEDVRKEFRVRKAMEFFNEIRPELGAQLPTFDEWNETENRENSDPVGWFSSNLEVVNKLLGQ
jgi:hypothetical protein